MHKCKKMKKKNTIEMSIVIVTHKSLFDSKHKDSAYAVSYCMSLPAI